MSRPYPTASTRIEQAPSTQKYILSEGEGYSPSGHTPTAGPFNESHRNALNRLRAQWTYFTVFHDFVRVLRLTMEESYTLSDMLNSASMNDAESNGGWFKYTVAWMQDRTNAERDAQQRILGSLVKKGLIRVEKRGMPAVRMVWIDLVELENRIITEVTKKPQKPPVNGISCQLENDPTVNGKSRSLDNGISRCDNKEEDNKEKKEPPVLRDSVAIAPSSLRTPPDEPPPTTQREAVNEPKVARADLLGGVERDVWESRCARLLHESLTKAQRIRKDFSPAKWAVEFRKLRDEGLSEEHVSAVLEGYCAHPEVWSIHSASGFRKSFDVIASKTRREGGKQSRSDCPQTQSARARSPRATPQELIPLIKEVEALGWPNGAQTQITDEVIETHARLTEFTRDLKGLLKRATAKPLPGLSVSGNAEFAEYLRLLLARVGLEPVGATKRWLVGVHLRVKGWKAWSGQLKPFRFDVNGRDVRRLAESVSTQFAHNTKPAETLFKLLDIGE